MADEDFTLDVYGDAEGGQDQTQNGGEDYKYENQEMGGTDHNEANGHDQANDGSGGHSMDSQIDDAKASTSPSPAPQQGVKRKELDDRPIDPGATNALLVSEMQWWVTEDDIRGWINSALCEDELRDITFSEHKVNGKSKGQAYVEFVSQQAATAAKHYIDSMQSGDGSGNQQRRPTVSFHSSAVNPFKTLPKDAPQRANRDNQGRGTSSGSSNFHNDAALRNFQAGGGGGFQGNFRGRGFNRGGPRGGYTQNYGNSNMTAFNSNMGFSNPMAGGFNRGGMGFNRGGPNMRGGRGGMNGMMGGGPGMMGNPMGMGGMNPMNMNMMAGMGGMNGMGAGFNGMPGQFNPGGGFFGGNQGGGAGGNFGGNNQGGGDWGNPHGAKRPRGE